MPVPSTMTASPMPVIGECGRLEKVTVVLVAELGVALVRATLLPSHIDLLAGVLIRNLRRL